MSANAENIKSQVNKWIRNYAVDAFHNLRLNSILLQIVDLVDGGSGGDSGGSQGLKITSVDFSNATDCPIAILDGKSIAVFFNEVQRYLDKGTEWSDLPGGGFKILISEFDATIQNYTFYVSYVM